MDEKMSNAIFLATKETRVSAAHGTNYARRLGDEWRRSK